MKLMFILIYQVQFEGTIHFNKIYNTYLFENINLIYFKYVSTV